MTKNGYAGFSIACFTGSSSLLSGAPYSLLALLVVVLVSAGSAQAAITGSCLGHFDPTNRDQIGSIDEEGIISRSGSTRPHRCGRGDSRLRPTGLSASAIWRLPTDQHQTGPPHESKGTAAWLDSCRCTAVQNHAFTDGRGREHEILRAHGCQFQPRRGQRCRANGGSEYRGLC